MHNQLNFTASPGIAIIKPIQDKEESIIVSDKNMGRIIRGQIVSMGDYDTTQTGEKIDPRRYGKVKDVVWFLHYYDEGQVDVMTVNGIKYFAVKWGDIRAIEK